MSSTDARWQYRVTELRAPEPEDMRGHMDELAGEGWELVSGSTATLYFTGSFSTIGQPKICYTMWWRKPAST